MDRTFVVPENRHGLIVAICLTDPLNLPSCAQREVHALAQGPRRRLQGWQAVALSSRNVPGCAMLGGAPDKRRQASRVGQVGAFSRISAGLWVISEVSRPSFWINDPWINGAAAS